MENYVNEDYLKTINCGTMALTTFFWENKDYILKSFK